MKCVIRCIVGMVMVLMVAGCGWIDIARPATWAAPSEPVLEEATMTCLGAYWIVSGGVADYATVEMAYRPRGQTQWTQCMPMYRVRRGDTTQDNQHQAELAPGPDQTIFAGSIIDVPPGRAYDLRLRLVGPRGLIAERVLAAHTVAEETDPAGMVTRHVVPGEGGGDGSQAKPFRGLDAAQAAAKPGTLFLLHKGLYEGMFMITASGQSGKPIIYRAAGDGDAVITGGPKTASIPPEHLSGVRSKGVHDVWLEGLCIKGFPFAAAFFDCANIVVRGCRIWDVQSGMVFTIRDGATPQHTLIADNDMVGPFTWDKDNHGAKVDELRGIQVAGPGYDVCYNRLRNFKDAIDTIPARQACAVDIHHNEISECMDDGIELDFSERNVRCFKNRLTDVFQGISTQPAFGGPLYVVRNVMYNVQLEPFKLHHVLTGPDTSCWPSGAIMYHNTVVKNGIPAMVWAATVFNCRYRNNLFIGGGPYAMEYCTTMIDCDFDYDGVGGGPWDHFLRWNGEIYSTMADARAHAPAYRHVTWVDEKKAFASGLLRPGEVQKIYKPADLRLKPGSEAIDAAQRLPGINDNFTGKAPDLGAYELGSDLPHYGPRTATSRPK